MKLKDMSLEELETMSYTQIAEKVLEEASSSMKIVDVFKKVCELLNLSNSEFENKVADFFELISTDKNFIVLEKGFCDLRKKHTPKVTIEEDDDDTVEVDVDVESDSEVQQEESEDDIYYDSSSDDDVDDGDDDLNDFAIVEDEEEANI